MVLGNTWGTALLRHICPAFDICQCLMHGHLVLRRLWFSILLSCSIDTCMECMTGSMVQHSAAFIGLDPNAERPLTGHIQPLSACEIWIIIKRWGSDKQIDLLLKSIQSWWQLISHLLGLREAWKEAHGLQISRALVTTRWQMQTLPEAILRRFLSLYDRYGLAPDSWIAWRFALQLPTYLPYNQID